MESEGRSWVKSAGMRLLVIGYPLAGRVVSARPSHFCGGLKQLQNLHIRTFEDLECWKACRELRIFVAKEVVPVLPREERFGLVAQHAEFETRGDEGDIVIALSYQY